jgi:hypothetical protein
MEMEMRHGWMAFVGVCALGGALATGCAKARAVHEPEMPPLAMPMPPDRVLPPLEAGPIEAAAPEQQPETPEQRRPPARQRGETARADTQRVVREDTVKPEAQQPLGEASVPPEPAPVPAAPALQLAPSADAASEQGIRRQLTRASGDLGNVDYRALNDDAKAQYETAKRFIELAEQSIRDRNLVFAQTLADKAQAIAEVLRR